MYDIESLEQQWKRYKRKKFVLPIVLGVLLFVFGFMVLFWVGAKHPDTTQESTVSSSSNQSMPQTAETKNAPSSLSSEVPSIHKNSVRKKGWKMTFADSDSAENAHAEGGDSSPHIAITVTSKNVKASVSDMESRFLSDPRKEDALYLAKYYYAKKAYKKAIQWALETNKLDSDIEESWLIFGKAKAKLGMRTEAIRVLQAYYDRTGSLNAKKILGKIRRGKAF